MKLEENRLLLEVLRLRLQELADQIAGHPIETQAPPNLLRVFGELLQILSSPKFQVSVDQVGCRVLSCASPTSVQISRWSSSSDLEQPVGDIRK